MESIISVPGVRSISVDLHKYGYAARPASVAAYATAEDARHQLFYFDEWAEGPYPTVSFIGSRPGGAEAAEWSVMRFLGREGYGRLVAPTLEVKRRLAEGIDAIEGLKTWDTDLCILLFEAEDYDIMAVAKGMTEQGWFIMGTQESDGSASLIHLTVDPVDDAWVETFLNDLRGSPQVRALARSMRRAAPCATCEARRPRAPAADAAWRVACTSWQSSLSFCTVEVSSDDEAEHGRAPALAVCKTWFPPSSELKYSVAQESPVGTAAIHTA